MKKYLFIAVLAGCLAIAPSCTNSKGENSSASSKSGIPVMLDRTVITGADAEREELLTAYDKAILTLETNPTNLQQYINLAQVFITEGRLTGNLGYYNSAAMQMLDKVLEQDPTDNDILFQAYTFKSGVLMSMHQFKDALNAANKAFAISQHNAQLFGALVDANVELGNYTEAVKMCDNMMQLRPDIRSYSRVSYLRQIYGDNAGAIDAMKMAVEAGVPGAESTEWARIILGDLLLMTGDIKSAEICYTTALGLRKNYPYAEAGLGRLEKAKKNYTAAIQHTENAINMISDVAFVNQLADIYELKGDSKKAKEIRKDVLSLLEKSEKEQNKEKALVKHNGARELAIVHLNIGKIDQALKYAKEDLDMRPENIDANELIAWIYYLKGDYSNAKVHADKMLATHSKNPSTLYKAGLIYCKAGDEVAGQSLRNEALAINPAIDIALIQSK
ncbi:MAG: tetratricopeptide repeat protein [Chitinophagales bacterium]